MFPVFCSRHFQSFFQHKWNWRWIVCGFARTFLCVSIVDWACMMEHFFLLRSFFWEGCSLRCQVPSVMSEVMVMSHDWTTWFWLVGTFRSLGGFDLWFMAMLFFVFSSNIKVCERLRDRHQGEPKTIILIWSGGSCVARQCESLFFGVADSSCCELRRFAL